MTLKFGRHAPVILWSKLPPPPPGGSSFIPRESVTVTTKSFIASATSPSLEIILSPSVKIILLFECNLSEEKVSQSSRVSYCRVGDM